MTARGGSSGALLGDFIDGLSDLQSVAVWVFEHILASVPRTIAHFFDDFSAALTMLRKNGVDILNPEKDVRMDIAALEHRDHLGIMRHIKEHAIAFHAGINGRLTEYEMLFETEHA